VPEPRARPRDPLFDELGLGAFKLAAAAVRTMPRTLTDSTAAWLGLLFSQGMRRRRVIVERNLRRVLGPGLRGPELWVLVQAAFDSYTRYWVEGFRLPGLTGPEIDAGLRTRGYRDVVAALDQGRGAILALPHLGGWEWAGRWLAERGHKITVVVEPVQPPELFEWFVSWRRDLGMQVVPLGPEAGSTVLRALKANEIVCLVCDRDLSRTGVDVEFFGERTTLPAGPATLALRTGAPLMPTAVYFTGARDGHLGLTGPAIPIERTRSLRADVATVTQQLAHRLEDLIRRAPEQWHLFQPNWPSDPGYER
jgi:KDO2-lipid IV(A) lauroyltransferase